MTRLRDVAAIRRSVLAIGFAFIGAGAALAQTAAPMTDAQVRSCLCQQQALSAADSRLKSDYAPYLQRQQELQSIDAELKSVQQSASPGDAAAVVKAQELIDRRNTLRDQLRSDAGPYNARVSDYNALAAKYNAECTSQSMLTFDVEAAKKALSCPGQ
jgi:hypothetical protein